MAKNFQVKFLSSVVNDDNEKPLFFMAITKDISERKRIERAKSEFTSIASHQLRTPLSIMSWYSEMILAGKAGVIKKKQKKYIKEIHNANY